jgi:hypothetical protein
MSFHYHHRSWRNNTSLAAEKEPLGTWYYFAYFFLQQLRSAGIAIHVFRKPKKHAIISICFDHFVPSRSFALCHASLTSCIRHAKLSYLLLFSLLYVSASPTRSFIPAINLSLPLFQPSLAAFNRRVSLAIFAASYPTSDQVSCLPSFLPD